MVTLIFLGYIATSSAATIAFTVLPTLAFRRNVLILADYCGTRH